MFCDLVGSTALATKLDPEDLREVIAEYRDGVAAIVRKYGGTISRYIGDGMLILFGHPSAHEDDPERAVRAALEIAAAGHAPSVPPDLELRVRLGLATGLVIVGDLIGSEAAEPQAVPRRNAEPGRPTASARRARWGGNRRGYATAHRRAL